jgi:hypothetical protein
MGLLRHPFDLLSGPWSGRWIQGPEHGDENLDLVFQSGNLMGFGSDRDGAFQISGIYSPSGAAEFGKVYTKPTRPVPARMTYRGLWNGRCLVGRWTDDGRPDNAGPFRLWPGTGPDPDDILEAEADPPRERALDLVASHLKKGVLPTCF